MKRHALAPAGGPRLTHTADIAVRAAAVVLILAGAVLLISGAASAGIALPLIAIGVALRAIEWADQRREPVK